MELETELLLQRQEIDGLQTEVQRLKQELASQRPAGADPETALQLQHLREAKEQLRRVRTLLAPIQYAP